MRELAGPAHGRTLLDVGAGDGTLATAWSDAGWRVTASEPESSMRAAARRRHPGLMLATDALPELSFAEHEYGVVVANFVLNHLDDPRAGAAELLRVSRDAAIATTWIASPAPLWAEVTERAGLAPAAGARLPADKDFERTASGFEQMLCDAGWMSEITELTWTWNPTAAMLWGSVEGGVAGAGAYYRALSDADRARFRAAFDSVTAERSVDGSVPLPHTAAIAIHRFR